MTNWMYADIFEAVAARVPDRPCQIRGERVITWGEFDRRSNAIGNDLLAAGLGHQAKVAAYLYNGVEYMETYVAAFKAGMAPVNTNYRYGPDEIVYLFDNADAEAVVFHASFAGLLEGVRDRLPKVRRWYVVADETGDGPAWAISYEQVIGGGDTGRVVPPWGRSGDDLLLLYTGGTTGMPRGRDVAPGRSLQCARCRWSGPARYPAGGERRRVGGTDRPGAARASPRSSPARSCTAPANSRRWSRWRSAARS